MEVTRSVDSSKNGENRNEDIWRGQRLCRRGGLEEETKKGIKYYSVMRWMVFLFRNFFFTLYESDQKSESSLSLDSQKDGVREGGVRKGDFGFSVLRHIIIIVMMI